MKFYRGISKTVPDEEQDRGVSFEGAARFRSGSSWPNMLREVTVSCCHNRNNGRTKKYFRDPEAHMAKSMVERLGRNSVSSPKNLEKLVERGKSATPVNYVRLVDLLFDYSAPRTTSNISNFGIRYFLHWFRSR